MSTQFKSDAKDQMLASLLANGHSSSLTTHQQDASTADICQFLSSQEDLPLLNPNDYISNFTLFNNLQPQMGLNPSISDLMHSNLLNMGMDTFPFTSSGSLAQSQAVASSLNFEPPTSLGLLPDLLMNQGSEWGFNKSLLNANPLPCLSSSMLSSSPESPPKDLPSDFKFDTNLIYTSSDPMEGLATFNNDNSDLEKYFNIEQFGGSSSKNQDYISAMSDVNEHSETLKLPIKRLRSLSSSEKKTLNPASTKPVDSKSKSHNVIEKKYRSSLLDGISELKNELPFVISSKGTIVSLVGISPPSKFNKSTILRKATEFIQYLKKNNEKLEDENSKLKNLIRTLPGGESHLSNFSSTLVANNSSSPDAASPLSYSSGVRFMMIGSLCLGLYHIPSSSGSSIIENTGKIASLSLIPIFIIGMIFFAICLMFPKVNLSKYLTRSKQNKTLYNMFFV